MIRLLTEDDVSELYILRLEALKTSPTSFGSSYEKEKETGLERLRQTFAERSDGNVIFGSYVDGKLVGAVGLFAHDQLKSRHKTTLWGMYVQGPYRKMGLARALILNAIEHAKHKVGAKTIYLSVESNNSAAKNLYLRSGFSVWGREPRALCVDGHYYDEDHMFLHLND